MTHAIVRRRRRERAERIAQATAWAERLAHRLPLRAAVVVGSVARGDFNKWSDLDVLVIADELPDDSLERMATLDTDAPPGLQAIGWTPDELAHRRARRDPIAIEADTVGVVVWGHLTQ